MFRGNREEPRTFDLRSRPPIRRQELRAGQELRAARDRQTRGEGSLAIWLRREQGDVGPAGPA